MSERETYGRPQYVRTECKGRALRAGILTIILTLEILINAILQDFHISLEKITFQGKFQENEQCAFHPVAV